MTGRVRMPSRKAVEIALSKQEDGVSKSAEKQPKPKAKPKPKTKSKKGVVSNKNTEQSRVYCICLSQDDESPMIGCEGCENWFHFRCIELTDEEAEKIETYYCDMCEGAGIGKTIYMDQANTPSSVVQEQQATEPPAVTDDPADRTNKRPIDALSVKSVSSKMKKGTDNSSSEDDDNNDATFTVDENQGPSKKPAKRPKPQPRRSVDNPILKSPVTESHASLAANDKKRKACVDQLLKICESIFEADPSRVTEFANACESKLFEIYSELEKGRQVPGVKYISKFRTLHFNLKSNEYLRNRIINGEMDAEAVVRAEGDDLLTPEQRKAAEEMREKSIKDSIKVQMAAPVIRRTHKGEELIENPEGGVSMVPTDSAADTMDSKNDINTLVSSASKISSPPITHSPTTPLIPERRHSIIMAMDEDVQSTGSSPNAPQANQNTGPSFNLESVWDTIKIDPETGEKEAKEEDDMDVGNSDIDEPQPADERRHGEDYDPLDFEKKGEEEDLDKLLHDEPSETKQSKEEPENVYTNEVAAPLGLSSSNALATSPVVWSGVLTLPEEGSFPAVAVQVAGRPLGTSEILWTSIMPDVLYIEGRVATAKSDAYLLENVFARTREVIVVALLPDLSGPSPMQPNKPIASEVLEREKKVIDSFIKKDRYGVVEVPSLKPSLKEIYIGPLRNSASFPEFFEVLDYHIPESGHRQRDILLAALTITKGLDASNVRPALPAHTPSHLPTYQSQPPPPQAPSQPALSSLPPNLDNKALDNILSILGKQPTPTAVSVPPAAPPKLDTNILSQFANNPALLQSILSMSKSSDESNPNSSASPGQQYESQQYQHPPRFHNIQGGPPYKNRSQFPPRGESRYDQPNWSNDGPRGRSPPYRGGPPREHSRDSNHHGERGGRGRGFRGRSRGRGRGGWNGNRGGRNERQFDR